ncbi:hypothetical protein AS189_13985 [Arthrobacter alpinus]|uniref:non-specific serine/threonine protein kinase n=1 Tax=Arthrobacter alpinus TaxID=656366 RepID=A0A0S2M141_9MICC|nr:serine/threonine-protein kinase [Arthrobacter alpinus]ALO67396.1 hypothetical protein AS189_13985 [Arthrobacter alpinus]
MDVFGNSFGSSLGSPASKSVLPHWPPRISGFDPVRSLGGGSQGQVWLMSPHDGSGAVAAKFLTPDAISEGGVRAGDPSRHNESQITQEWQLVTQFRHEHLIPVHRLLVDDRGELVLIMEFAAGGSLSQIVRARGPLSVGEVVTILTPIGQLLAFLHGRGAVHGDVSSGNVLISASGKPFLADFGCSRLLGQAPGELAGTPGFYCPSDRRRDDSSDVYALAAVGWFALTGQPPPITRERPPLASQVVDVPRELVAALEAGLQEDPVQRPAAAALAQAVFRSARAESIILANAVHPSVLPELPTRRGVQRKLKVRSGNQLGNRRRFVGRKGGGDADGVPMKRLSGFGRRRRVKGLAPLWGSADTTRSAGRHSGRRSALRSESGAADRTAERPGPSTAGRPIAGAPGSSSRVRGRAAAWIIGILGLCAAVLGISVASGGWSGTGDNETSSLPGSGGSESLTQTAPLPPAWASALPPKIQRGLMATAPQEALSALAWTRSFALSNRDQELLNHINAVGSPVLAADTAIVTALDATGHGFTGLEFTVEKVHSSHVTNPVSGSDADGNVSRTLQATIVTSSFAEQDANGAVVHNQPQEQRQELRFVLVKADSRWAIQQILESEPIPDGKNQEKAGAQK